MIEYLNNEYNISLDYSTQLVKELLARLMLFVRSEHVINNSCLYGNAYLFERKKTQC